MTLFEQFLLSKGYIRFILDCKTMKYEPAKGYIISTMVNLDHRYFHNTDKNVLQKIESDKSVRKIDNEITPEDRKGEIIFGLNQRNKPSTLIFPRPRIEVKRIKEGKELIETEDEDDSMNVVLMKVSNEEIFKAMYDRSICIRIDLT